MKKISMFLIATLMIAVFGCGGGNANNGKEIDEVQSVSLVGNWTTVGWAEDNEPMRTIESYLQGGLHIDDLNIPYLLIKEDNTFRFNTSVSSTTGNIIEIGLNEYITIGTHFDESDTSYEEESRLQYDPQSWLLRHTTLYGEVKSHVFLRRETADRAVATETMTMTTDITEITIMLAGEGKTTIDWGDGTVIETDELDEFNSYSFEGAQEYRHVYISSSVRTITITGVVTMLRCINAGLTEIDVSQNPVLMYLYCSDNQLSALDVSRNTELLDLRCSANQLRALDVSNNTALYYFYCIDNQLRALNLKNNTALHGVDISNNMFTATELNALFETLHNERIMGEGMITQWIRIGGNPGTTDSDQSIVNDKGWTVEGFAET